MEIEGMLYLLALFGTPALVFALSGTKILPTKSKPVLALISFCILYGAIVGSAKVADYQIEQELYTFDLDGSGSFSPKEMTPEAEAVMDRFSHDTGRTFAPITGFIFSFFYVTLFFGVAKLVSKYVFKST